MKHNNGTFVAVKFREDVVEILDRYAIANGVPNRIPKDDYHSTVAYSRTPLNNVPDDRILTPSWIGYPLAFDIFESVGYTTGVPGTKCLVLKYQCSSVLARHNYLKQYANATHDFPSFLPHITLSYDIGDYDITQLSSINEVLPEIIIVQEYSQELKHDRSKEATQEGS